MLAHICILTLILPWIHFPNVAAQRVLPPFTSLPILASFENKIIMYGGTEHSLDLLSVNATNAMWEFDIPTAQWKLISPNRATGVPFLESVSGSVVGSNLYIAGVQGGQLQIHVYDLAQNRGVNSWQQLSIPNLPALIFFGFAATPRRLYITGGRNIGGIDDLTNCTAVELSALTVTPCAPIKTTSNGLTSSANQIMGWVVTTGGFGSNVGYVSDLNYRRPDVLLNAAWETMTFLPREGPCLVPYRSGFVYYGGKNATEVTRLFNYQVFSDSYYINFETAIPTIINLASISNAANKPSWGQSAACVIRNDTLYLVGRPAFIDENQLLNSTTRIIAVDLAASLRNIAVEYFAPIPSPVRSIVRSTPSGTSLTNTPQKPLLPTSSQISLRNNSSDNSNQLPVGGIVGGVLGGLVFLGVTLGGVWFFFYKKKPLDRERTPEEPWSSRGTRSEAPQSTPWSNRITRSEGPPPSYSSMSPTRKFTTHNQPSMYYNNEDNRYRDSNMFVPVPVLLSTSKPLPTP